MLYQPTLLTDTDLLPEIYRLRVNVWQNSSDPSRVNQTLFPNGWTDKLDQEGKHIIIQNESSKVIASARVNCFHSFQEFPFREAIKHISLPHSVPFGYYSRLVVDENYQGMGLSSKLDTFVFQLSERFGLHWLLGLSYSRTSVMTQKLGFKLYGTAQIKYHPETELHKVDVIIKEFLK